MTEVLQKIIGKKVKRLFLVVWPPYGEIVSQIDISIGFVFYDAPRELLIISTDMNDLVTPIIELRSIPNNYFEWDEFNPRMKDWMNCVKGMDMDLEFYEISNVNIFKSLVNQKIERVEFVEVVENDPIGVKVSFEDDYVLSTPINDGNTIETVLFNKNGNVNNFSSLGEITYRDISKK